MKKRIKILVLGNHLNFINFKKIESHSSKLFFIEIERIVNNLPNPRNPSPYLNQYYENCELKKFVGSDSGDFLRIVIVNASLERNFYVQRLDDNTVVISIKNILEFLNGKSITIENFLLKNIYEIFTLYMEFEKGFTESAFLIPHRETRGCLFDLNGDIKDIIYNTEQPKICSDCYSRLEKKSLPPEFIQNLKKELKKIKKPFIQNIEIVIKKKPFISILVTIILTIFLNFVSNFLYDMISISIFLN